MSFRIQSECGEMREKCGAEKLRLQALFAQFLLKQMEQSLSATEQILDNEIGNVSGKETV